MQLSVIERALEDRPRQKLNRSTRPVILESRVVTGTGGGPDKTILNSPRFLAPAGYRTVCAYMHPPDDPGFGELCKKARLWEAELLSVPDRGPWDWRVLTGFLEICRREQVTIWHGHDYKSNVLGLLLRSFWPMHLVTTVHGWVKETRRTPLYYGLDRFCLPFYEKVICVSDDLYARCLAARVPAERCTLIENGIDTEVFSRKQDPEDAKQKLGLSAGRLLIGAVGRLSNEKGFDILIRSTANLLASGLKVDLAIVGEGEERDALQDLSNSLGCKDHVHLVGYRAEVKEFYEAMDVFVLSSRREGLPNVVLEAMAMEVPVIATRVAGVPRLIEDGQNGFLVEPGQEEKLTQALARMLGDAAMRARFSLLCRKMVETRYSFRNRMNKIRELYDDLLGRS